MACRKHKMPSGVNEIARDEAAWALEKQIGIWDRCAPGFSTSTDFLLDFRGDGFFLSRVRRRLYPINPYPVRQTDSFAAIKVCSFLRRQFCKTSTTKKHQEAIRSLDHTCNTV
jgi:hypothetical protein